MVGLAYNLNFDALHEYGDDDTGITVPVILNIRQLNEKTLAKVDTGASYCIFKREHGEALGLDIESGARLSIATATEPFLTYGHQVSLSSLSFHFDLMIYFAARSGLPRNVLGRNGWIEHLRLGIVDYDRKLYISCYDNGHRD